MCIITVQAKPVDYGARVVIILLTGELQFVERIHVTRTQIKRLDLLLLQAQNVIEL